MDRAYEGDNMRATAKELGYTPVVPPKKNRIDPWEYDEELYKRRNEVERFFRRIKRFRRVFTRYDKLDIVFAGFILFAMIVDTLVWTGSNTYSYLEHEFEQAKKKEKTIIVVYNSLYKWTDWLPTYMSDYNDQAQPFWVKNEYGEKVGNYAFIKKALGYE